VTWGEWSDVFSSREARVSPLGERLSLFTITSGVSFPYATPVALGGPAVIYASSGPISRLFLRVPIEESRRRAASH
jgi:hypothetical protein